MALDTGPLRAHPSRGELPYGPPPHQGALRARAPAACAREGGVRSRRGPGDPRRGARGARRLRPRGAAVRHPDAASAPRRGGLRARLVGEPHAARGRRDDPRLHHRHAARRDGLRALDVRDERELPLRGDPRRGARRHGTGREAARAACVFRAGPARPLGAGAPAEPQGAQGDRGAGARARRGLGQDLQRRPRRRRERGRRARRLGRPHPDPARRRRAGPVPAPAARDPVARRDRRLPAPPGRRRVGAEGRHAGHDPLSRRQAQRASNSAQSATPAQRWPSGPVTSQAAKRARIRATVSWWPPMAAPNVSTSVTELPESRVRVDAEVPPEEVEKRIARAARELGRNMRVPGFRAGKAPPPVVIKRVGRDVVLDEAVRDSIAAWYSAAIDAAAIVPVGEPELDMGELPGQGQPLTFSIEIGVRPTAQLGEYKGLEAGKREPAVGDEQVEAEVEQLRERAGRLETVDRAAVEGDFVVMDYRGTLDGEPFAGGEGRDQMIELGSGRLVPGFEEQLTGATAGEERTVKVTFPEDYGAEELAGNEAEFAVTVKEVKAKELPPVDDDLAAEAGFDTLDELRDDIGERLSETDERQIDAEFREAVLDSAVANAKVDVPEPLLEARSRELWEQMLHSLGHQGISKEMYLQISGRSEDDIVAEGKADAERQLKREAVLAAIVDAESIEPSEDELLEALEQAAPSERTRAKKLLERMRSAGRLDAFKAELAQRKALDLLADSARPITVEQAQARDKLWTPGAESGERPSQLWTPGS